MHDLGSGMRMRMANAPRVVLLFAMALSILLVHGKHSVVVAGESQICDEARVAAESAPIATINTGFDRIGVVPTHHSDVMDAALGKPWHCALVSLSVGLSLERQEPPRSAEPDIGFLSRAPPVV